MQTIQNRALLKVLCDASEQALAVVNPATDEVLGYVPTLSEADIHLALERAHGAQKQWAARTAKDRATIIRQWFNLVIQNRDDLARIITLEQGKPLAEANSEVVYGASFIEWFAEQGKRSYGHTIPAHNRDRRLATIKQPVGVAAAITPWNFPIAMITRKAAPALAAGCSFVAKPANQTPLTAYAVAELAYQAGIPQDALQVVTHHSSTVVGKFFCESPIVRKLSFTGSTRVGRQLMAQCAPTVKRLSLELGGNAPFIVFNDANIDAAVAGAVASKFRNGGQTCVCAHRFYVHRAVYDEFVARFHDAVKQLRVGNGMDHGVHIGPMIDQAAKDKVNGLVTRAIQEGAHQLTEQSRMEGLFMMPTILVNVRQGMDIVHDEIFGPVAPIIPFQSDEELIEMANDTIYGLAAYFYSQNISRIWRVAEALEYGMVGINEGIISTEQVPFGGVKQSGFGREGGQEGIEEYLDTKYLCFGGI